jgi:hypothetical protein
VAGYYPQAVNIAADLIERIDTTSCGSTARAQGVCSNQRPCSRVALPRTAFELASALRPHRPTLALIPTQKKDLT